MNRTGPSGHRPAELGWYLGCYRICLALLPRPFRLKNGDEICAVVEARLEGAARSGGRMGVFRTWLFELTDLVRAAGSQWRGLLLVRSDPGPEPRSRPSILLFLSQSLAAVWSRSRTRDGIKRSMKPTRCS